MPKRFCIAIVVLLIVLMSLSFLPIHGEEEIYDTVVRLHVLANSDSEEDQALKLKVRDAILRVSSPLLGDCHTRDEAAAILTAHTPDLQKAAEQVIADAGRHDAVTILLGEEDYPTRTYETCAFPAGRYLSLRVCIGEAQGHNWWCVLFPPLCLSAATADRSDERSSEDEFIAAGLSKDQYGIITETGKTKYKVRFKILEVMEDWFN